MHTLSRRLIPGCAIVLLFCFVPLAAQEGYEGAETCAACHEEVVAAFGKTAHAIAPHWNAETGCETCHGPGADHVEGDETAIVRFADLTPLEASKRCLSCHERQESHFTAMLSIHRLSDVGCTDCHNTHATANNALEQPAAKLCGSCHQAMTAMFDLPRSHPTEDCTDCHSPHATRSLRGAKDLYYRTCGACHFEKTQPFLYNHDTMIVDGCVACHQVHGSPNRHLLRHQTQVNLCYECHSAVVTPGWHSAPQFLNEKCTACHSAIHGSNTSPFFLEE